MPSTTTDRLSGLTTSVAIKPPCVVAATSNVTLFGEQTISSVACVAGDRVLLTAQTSAVQNGIWVVVAGGAWERAKDFDGVRDVVRGTLVTVIGSAGTGQVWRVDTAGAITPGVTSIAFSLALFSDAATVAFLQSGTGSVVRTAQDKMRDGPVSPMDKDATGDGTADDTAEVLAALNDGRMVDGGDRTYAVTGSLVPTSFGGIKRLKLKQLTPLGSNIRALVLDGFDDWSIEGLEINRNGGSTVGDMANYGALHVSNCSRFSVTKSLAKNGGPGSVFRFDTCDDFDVSENAVRDMTHDVGATNDIIQAILFNDCTNFTAEKNRISNLVGASTTLYTRGIAVGGCSHFELSGNIIDGVDQGIDISGTVGNHNFVVSTNVLDNIGTWGIKVANSGYSYSVRGNSVKRSGFGGYVVSGPTETTNPLPRDALFEGNVAIDIGSNGLWPSPVAYYIISQTDVVGYPGGVLTSTYPRGIHFKNNSAVDNQAVKTMARGFENQVAPVESPTSGYNKPDTNTVVGCSVVGVMTPGAAFTGWHYPVCIAVGTGTSGAITTATWTAVDLAGTDIFDPSGMHNPASNASNAYIREPGTYEISARTSFEPNATGTRRIRFMVNGVFTGEEYIADAHPTGRGYVQGFLAGWELNSEDNIRMEVYQDSGGNLTIDRAVTSLSVKKLP